MLQPQPAWLQALAWVLLVPSWLSVSLVSRSWLARQLRRVRGRFQKVSCQPAHSTVGGVLHVAPDSPVRLAVLANDLKLVTIEQPFDRGAVVHGSPRMLTPSSPA